MDDENITPDLELDENQNQDVDDTSGSDSDSESTKDWQAEVARLQAENKKFKAILDRKARKEENLEQNQSSKKSEEVTLSPLDAIAIAKADVPIEDIDDVIEIAKLKKVSVREALSMPITKTILAEKEEYRKSAKATNAGGGKRGPQATSPETLLKNLSEGKTPERGSKEAEDLFWARRGGRR